MHQVKLSVARITPDGNEHSHGYTGAGDTDREAAQEALRKFAADLPPPIDPSLLKHVFVTNLPPVMPEADYIKEAPKLTPRDEF